MHLIVACNKWMLEIGRSGSVIDLIAVPAINARDWRGRTARSVHTSGLETREIDS